jgi:hypothetical protein
MLRVALALMLSLWACVAAAQPVEKLCAEGLSAQGTVTCATTIQPQATATAVESNHVFKTSAANVVDFQVNTDANAVVVMLFDATALPSNGAVTGCANATTPRPCVVKWWQLAASSTLSVTWAPGPFPALQTGMVLGCSSGAVTFFTLTASAHCTFSAEVM